MLPFLLAAAAAAHPMGALSTNRSAILAIGPDRTTVRYTVDFAEVPSAAEAARAAELGQDAWATARMTELLPGLSLTDDGADVPLRIDRCFGSAGTGDGGLPTELLLCTLEAPAVDGHITFSDAGFPGSPGWRELRLVTDRVTASDVVPAAALVTGDVLLPFSSPPELLAVDRVEATVSSGGAVGSAVGAAVAVARAPDALAALLAGELSPAFVLLAVASAAGLGALHALTPGHGKTAVAAFLAGSRGTSVHALVLGLVVTATHVSSVLVVGALAAALGRFVDAGRLYPWLGVLSGAAIVGVGAWLLMSAVRGRDDHDHVHPAPGWGGLVVLGATWGVVPCPSALVVLLAAIGTGKLLFGVALVLAFSIGLAAVLVGIGLLVVRAGDLLRRSGIGEARWIPVASAAVVMALGVGVLVEAVAAR